MEYLLLWSGELRGMKKARIPAVAHAGLSGNWRDGICYNPSRDSIRAALPYRLRAAFDRAAIWFDRHNDSKPCTAYLTSTRGKQLATLYFQPLKESLA